MAEKKITCIYIMQLDEVRKDHISVYGYHRKHYLRAEPKGIVRAEMPEEEKKATEERLRRLGYISE